MRERKKPENIILIQNQDIANLEKIMVICMQLAKVNKLQFAGVSKGQQKPQERGVFNIINSCFIPMSTYCVICNTISSLCIKVPSPCPLLGQGQWRNP